MKLYITDEHGLEKTVHIPDDSPMAEALRQFENGTTMEWTKRERPQRQFDTGEGA